MYKVKFTETCLKQLQKLDHNTNRLIKNWIIKHLVGCIDPTIHGKALKGNLKGYWRYRVGDYRLIAKIQDKELIILIIEVGHRKEIYK